MPESLLAITALAFVLFVSTNVDDVALLVAFLVAPGFRTREVVAGQIVGIGALYAISVAASQASAAIVPEHVAWLGLIPIALGIKELIEQLRDGADDDEAEAARRTTAGGAIGRTAAVVGVTMANGGDNLGVYIPVFAGRRNAELVTIGIVFAVLTIALCAAGHWLVHHSAFSEHLRRYAGRVVPFVLIAIGVWILLEPRLGW